MECGRMSAPLNLNAPSGTRRMTDAQAPFMGDGCGAGFYAE